MRKGYEASDKAKHYRHRAAAAANNKAIFSDDESALGKLQAKLGRLKAKQETMKTVNAAWRKAGRPAPDDVDGWRKVEANPKVTMSWDELGKLRLDQARDLLKRNPFPDYSLTNNNANIRRIKRRIKELEAAAELETTKTRHDGFEVVENVEENRVQVFFDVRPPKETCRLMRAHGFRFARYNKAWQRHLNDSGRFAVQAVACELSRHDQ